MSLCVSPSSELVRRGLPEDIICSFILLQGEPISQRKKRLEQEMIASEKEALCKGIVAADQE